MDKDQEREFDERIRRGDSDLYYDDAQKRWKAFISKLLEEERGEISGKIEGLIEEIELGDGDYTEQVDVLKLRQLLDIIRGKTH